MTDYAAIFKNQSTKYLTGEALIGACDAELMIDDTQSALIRILDEWIDHDIMNPVPEIYARKILTGALAKAWEDSVSFCSRPMVEEAIGMYVDRVLETTQNVDGKFLTSRAQRVIDGFFVRQEPAPLGPRLNY